MDSFLAMIQLLQPISMNFEFSRKQASLMVKREVDWETGLWAIFFSKRQRIIWILCFRDRIFVKMKGKWSNNFYSLTFPEQLVKGTHVPITSRWASPGLVRRERPRIKKRGKHETCSEISSRPRQRGVSDPDQGVIGLESGAVAGEGILSDAVAAGIVLVANPSRLLSMKNPWRFSSRCCVKE